MKIENIVAHGMRVAVLEDRDEEVSEGGIALPASAQRASQMFVTGVVTSVGRELSEKGLGYADLVGKRVVVTRAAGVPCELADGGQVRLVFASDIAGTIP